MNSSPFESKHASGKVGANSKLLDVVAVPFADKISINISTHSGRLGKMYIVKLPSINSVIAEVPGIHSSADKDNNDLLPLANIEPVCVLGPADDAFGGLYASMIASLVVKQSPHESRQLVIGLSYDLGTKPGQEIASDHRQELLEVVKLVQQCKVW